VDDRPAPTAPAFIGPSHPAPAGSTLAVELILALILQKYPDERLDGAVLDSIRDDIAAQLRRSRVLSGFPLQNGDRPALVFTPFRAESGDEV
jgi:hypothetical protein